MVRSLDLLGEGEQFLVAHDASLSDLTHDSTLVADGLDDVALGGVVLTRGLAVENVGSNRCGEGRSRGYLTWAR